MRTPSHFIMTAIINYSIPKNQRRTFAFLLGSVLPDLPFAILTVIYSLYFTISGSNLTDVSLMEYLHFDLFFSDSIWIISHNIFHSLVVGLLMLAIAYSKRDTEWGKWLLWLTLAILLHTIIDIFTHHSDGPLFLFPLNWVYRFESPISYWESEYFGSQFRIFEYLLNAFLAVVLFLRYWRQRNVDEPKAINTKQNI